jgi:hypothetical protein
LWANSYTSASGQSSSRFTFDGKRENYHEFDSQLKAALSQQGIGYLLEFDRALQRIARPVRPTLGARPGVEETPQERFERESNEKLLLVEFSNEVKEYKMAELETHVEKSIAVSN